MIKLNLVGSIAAATLAASASSVIAESESSQHYLMEMQIHDGGRLIAEPRLKIEAGQPAIISVGGENQAIYSIRIVAKPETPSTVNFVSQVEITSPPRRALIAWGNDWPLTGR